MRCVLCGKEIEDGRSFCETCEMLAAAPLPEPDDDSYQPAEEDEEIQAWKDMNEAIYQEAMKDRRRPFRERAKEKSGLAGLFERLMEKSDEREKRRLEDDLIDSYYDIPQ